MIQDNQNRIQINTSIVWNNIIIFLLSLIGTTSLLISLFNITTILSFAIIFTTTNNTTFTIQILHQKTKNQLKSQSLSIKLSNIDPNYIFDKKNNNYDASKDHRNPTMSLFEAIMACSILIYILPILIISSPQIIGFTLLAISICYEYSEINKIKSHNQLLDFFIENPNIMINTSYDKPLDQQNITTNKQDVAMNTTTLQNAHMSTTPNQKMVS